MEIRPRAAPRGGIPGPRGTPREIPRPPDFGPPNWGPNSRVRGRSERISDLGHF